jgi:hypothetical protein
MVAKAIRYTTHNIFHILVLNYMQIYVNLLVFSLGVETATKAGFDY